MNTTIGPFRAAEKDIVYTGGLHILWLLVTTLTLLLQSAAAWAAEYTSGGFVILSPRMTEHYLMAHPDAKVALTDFSLETGEVVTVMHEPAIPTRMIVSGNNNMYDFPHFIHYEMSQKVVPCIDHRKDIYAILHGSRRLGQEFQFASVHKVPINGSVEDFARLLAALNEEFPGLLKRGSNVGVTSCFFEARLVRETAECGPHHVNTSAAIKLQRELMENSAFKELNMNVLSLSSESRTFIDPPRIMPETIEGAVCEQRSEVRLLEEVEVDTGRPYVPTDSTTKPKTRLQPISPKQVTLGLLDETMEPKDAYKEIFLKNRTAITESNLKNLEILGTDLAEYVIKERRFAGFTPVQITPPPGSRLATKLFSKGLLFIDAAMSLWEIGKVTYHSVVFYNEHTGAVEGIARAAVMEDKWRSDIAGQIEDVKLLQYQEDAKWALSMLNYLLAVQAEKEELFTYWEREGIPREQFLDTHKLVNLNQKIINTLYKMRGTESYAAIDPELRSTAWRINVNPLLPGGTYYDPSWQPQPRPNLEELILIPDVREELLKIISDLDCDRAKRYLGGKTAGEIGHADLIALLGFIGSQAYQELVDAAALVQKPKTEFLDSTTKGWGFERKRTIENENRGSDERVYFNPAVWIGVSGPGKLGEEYFSFLK